MISRARKITILAVAASTASLGGWWSWLWYAQGRHEVTTDNAYVRGETTSISPRVSGYVTNVLVSDNATVVKGDELFHIDGRDYRAKVDQGKATVAIRISEIANISATRDLQHALIAQAIAQKQSAVADLEFTQANLERYAALRQSGSASEQKFDDAQAANSKAQAVLDGATANVQAQNLRLRVLDAQVAGAEAALSQARAALDLAKIDLESTVVRAPVNGVIGNRQVRTGRYLAPGAAVMDIVPVHDVWIVANYKETQLRMVEINQPVRVTVDEYPGVELQGIVDSFAPGSGAAFSILPPDNATGNFIRVVQRVPVKIRLASNPLLGRLVPGLSAHVSIQVGRAS